MRQKFLYALAIFIIVFSTVILGNKFQTAHYYNKLNDFNKIIEYNSQPIVYEGLFMEVCNFLKITDFVNFVNTLPQKLGLMGMMYIFSLIFLSLRLYLQKLFNQYNIAVKFPVVSTFCLIVYMAISFTFTANINFFETLLIYGIVIISIELIKLIWKNDKKHTIKKDAYNELDVNNKPLYFTAMKRKKIHILDMAIAGFIFITVKGIFTIPIIYVIFATIPNCIYAYIQIQKTKNNIPISNVN